jgi:hypothetical protein
MVPASQPQQPTISNRADRAVGSLLTESPPLQYGTDRYTHGQTVCAGVSKCPYLYGSGTVSDDAAHNTVVPWNLADSRSRPNQSGIDVLRHMYYGHPNIVAILDESAEMYAKRLPGRWNRWRGIVRQLIIDKWSTNQVYSDTHGDSARSRLTFNAPGAQWEDMVQLKQTGHYCSLDGRAATHEAIMGLMLLHHMSAGGDPPIPLNDIEVVRREANSKQQGPHMDSSQREGTAHVFGLPDPRDAETPPSFTGTMNECGLNHGDPRRLTSDQQPLRQHSIQRAFAKGDQKEVTTKPLTSLSEFCLLSSLLQTMGVHFGLGCGSITLYGMFMGRCPTPVRVRPHAPDKHTTATPRRWLVRLHSNRPTVMIVQRQFRTPSVLKIRTSWSSQ